MMALRRILVMLFVIALPLSACGSIKGDKDVDTEDAEGGMGKGPGLLTGKRGGLIIYQR
ncbi:MAG: hypothetical protein OEU46_07870 [Alphaproteobacteria bacterium]|nr:hypothetical protein [Alphaproteobacteria bacterium]